MTATPKETKEVSNIDYFGEPVYTYSLKQGIEDGFLAPFKVVRVDLDKDVLGWRPEKGQLDDFGAEIPDQIWNQMDFDRDITFPGRTRAVAQWIANHMHADNPMHKTIVFCEDIDHAERMRQALVNVAENRELVAEDHRYVTRITGDEDEGKAQLDNFIDPKQSHPVIATTSKLMTTGVDAQTCHLIVLDQHIRSLTEFKQIIGRGTRLRTDYEKYFFTIIDFRKATELFADPDWDGPPLQDDEFDPNAPPKASDDDEFNPDEIGEVLVDPDPITDGSFDDEDEEGRRKYVVSGVTFSVLAERVQHYDKDGKLVTESLRDYTRRHVTEEFESLDEFVKRWSESDRKQAIVDELVERGVLLEALEENVSHEMDAFDLICHVAFDQPPMTRRERAENVRKRNVFAKYGETARAVLDALLEKYADQGIDAIEDIGVLKVIPIAELGTMTELVKSFGNKASYDAAVHELETELYRSAS
jgi:type I restriction enzyme R subunit